jgi:hypothetical protein
MAETVFVCENKPDEAEAHFYVLLAHDAAGNEVVPERLGDGSGNGGCMDR